MSLKKLPRTRTHLVREIDSRFNMRSARFPLGRHDDWADHIRAAESLANEMNDTASLARANNYLCSHHWIH
jgi:hypothetical protein